MIIEYCPILKRQSLHIVVMSNKVSHLKNVLTPSPYPQTNEHLTNSKILPGLGGSALTTWATTWSLLSGSVLTDSGSVKLSLISGAGTSVGGCSVCPEEVSIASATSLVTNRHCCCPSLPIDQIKQLN